MNKKKTKKLYCREKKTVSEKQFARKISMRENKCEQAAWSVRNRKKSPHILEISKQKLNVGQRR